MSSSTATTSSKAHNLIIENPGSFREKIRAKIRNFLPDEKNVINLERGIFNFALKEATQKNVVKKWKNPLFVQLYVDRLYSITTNLRNNPSLVSQINDGILVAQSVSFMTHQELFPERWNKLIEKKMKIDQNKYENKIEAATDTFTCRKCKSNKCTYYQVQTRSADEPMTTFVTCIDCGNRWKC